MLPAWLDLSDDGSITLLLDEACIETTARRAHRELVAHALDGDEVRGASLELLATFLDQEDFGALRSVEPKLRGEVPARVRLSRGPAGVAWEVVS